jgi:PPOX class probable F420-dependent enzyme
MSEMTPEETREFLTEGTRTAKLGTLTALDHPHVIPVWFILDGDEIVFTTGRDTVKGRYLLRADRVSLCVDDEHFPYSFVHIRGRAEIFEQADDLLHWATRIAERYVRAAEAEEYGRRNAVPTELLVRVRPDRVIAKNDIAGW